MIYFILAKKTNRLKIGYSKSASEVDRRFMFLLNENADDLELLAYIPGDFEHEHDLHRALADERAHNEWFEYNDTVKEVVARERALAGTSHSEVNHSAE